jgi:DNA repair exonuclease SbcCD ATPase subunit
MLRDTRNLPKPEEESDEPPVIRGEARFSAKKKPVGLGESMGLQRQREVEQAAKQRQEIFEGGAYVREATAAGISANVAADAKRAEVEGVRQRRLAERAEQDARQASLHKPSKPGASMDTAQKATDAADDKKTHDALRAKFDHAKVELEKEKRAATSTINKLRNQLKQLEGETARQQRELGSYEKTETQSEKAAEQIERELAELKSEERELTTSHGKLSSKDQSELRQVRSKMSTLSFKARLGERKVLAGAGSARRDESKLRLEKNQLKELQKEIGEHESRLALVDEMLREWQSKHSHSDLARVWKEWELDLRNKLGIHIYR